jgi:hypothetical protein
MFTKLIHLAKMTWMFTWRLLIIDAIIFKGGTDEYALVAGFILAAVMVFGFKQTLLTWPLIRLVTKKRVIIPSNSWGSNAITAPTKPVKKYKQPSRTKNQPEVEHKAYRDSASENGRITGYEPGMLAKYPVPTVSSMTGVPGSGLLNATEMTKTNVNLGMQGEENFARALFVEGLIHRFRTIWSVPVPDQEEFKPGPYSTDIDCVLATGNTIYLVDLKNYKSGAVQYHNKGNQLYCEDNITGEQVGEVKTMSRNMEMATTAMQHHFPKANILPVVVFMPTNKGEGFINKVVWPGGVQAMNLSQFLYKLKAEPDFSLQSSDAGAFLRIERLLPPEKETRQKEYPFPSDPNWTLDTPY